MKKYRFLAKYKKNDKVGWVEIDKLLELSEEESKLASESTLKFLVQQCKKGNLPIEGVYDDVRLCEET